MLYQHLQLPVVSSGFLVAKRLLVLILGLFCLWVKKRKPLFENTTAFGKQKKKTPSNKNTAAFGNTCFFPFSKPGGFWHPRLDPPPLASLLLLLLAEAGGGRSLDPPGDFAVPPGLQEAPGAKRDGKKTPGKPWKKEDVSICCIRIFYKSNKNNINTDRISPTKDRKQSQDTFSETDPCTQTMLIRNDKIVTTAAIKFMAHLVNQKAAGCY